MLLNFLLLGKPRKAEAFLGPENQKFSREAKYTYKEKYKNKKSYNDTKLSETC